VGSFAVVEFECEEEEGEEENAEGEEEGKGDPEVHGGGEMAEYSGVQGKGAKSQEYGFRIVANLGIFGAVDNDDEDELEVAEDEEEKEENGTDSSRVHEVEGGFVNAQVDILLFDHLFP